MWPLVFWGASLASIPILIRGQAPPQYPAVVLVENHREPTPQSVRLKASKTLRPALRSLGVRFAVADPILDPGWTEWLAKNGVRAPVAVYLDSAGRGALRWTGPRMEESRIVAGVRARRFPDPPMR